MESFSNQLAAAAFWSWLIERAKTSPYFPLLTKHTDTLNRIVAIVLSGVTTLGINYSATGDWMTGGTVTITLPAAQVILIGLWHWLQNFTFQQLVYHAAIKPNPRNLNVEVANVEQVTIERTPVEGAVKPEPINK